MKHTLLAFAVLLMAGSVHAAPAKGKTTDVDCKNETLYKDITKAELQKDIDAKKAFVIDANGADSYKEHHVPTAIHFGATKNLASALPADKNAEIVAYCGNPKCSAWKKPAMEACKLGYVNIRHFSAGIDGWVKQ